MFWKMQSIIFMVIRIVYLAKLKFNLRHLILFINKSHEFKM